MGKIQNMLSKLIMEAMKERNTIKKNAYTNLKTAFLNYVTSKEGVKECACDANGNKVISDEKELSIIKKMHKELARMRKSSTFATAIELTAIAKLKIERK